MERMHRTAAVAIASLLVLGAGAGLAAGGDHRGQEHERQSGRSGKMDAERQRGKMPMHGMRSMVVPRDELRWTDGPPSLPPGLEVAMLEGDLAKKGPFTVRIRIPEGYEIRPHTHPGIEHITVLSGTLHVGMGRTFDKEKGEELSAGGFAVMHPGMEHYVWTTEETVFQLHGMGPWGITYVNPDDDPRRRVRGEEPPADEP